MNISDLFTTVALTDSINKVPVPPTLLGSSGLFQEKGVRTTSIMVDQRNGRLVLVKAIDRNQDPTPKERASRSARTFEIPHLPLAGGMLPTDIQNVREFGQEADEESLQGPAEAINDELEEMKNSLEATREFQRVGAIKGVILDADNSVIYDLYEEFGVTKKTENLALSNANTKVRGFCQKVGRYVDQKTAAAGLLLRRRRALCGADFFDSLVDHPSVLAAYQGWAEAQDKIGGDVRSGFTFGGIEFIDASTVVGATTFVAANKAHVFPVAQGAFITRNAPANYNEAVNTRGKPYYAKAEPRRMGKGYDMEAQSNSLSVCLVPEALHELTAT